MVGQRFAVKRGERGWCSVEQQAFPVFRALFFLEKLFTLRGEALVFFGTRLKKSSHEKAPISRTYQ